MSSIDLDATHDFVIVGGGTAGCVLANRLSEDPRNSVVLIEAGPPDSNPLIRVPAGVAFTILNPKLGWGLKTVPQAHCYEREIPIPRGKVLGGSSSINGMVYIRGHPGDYDDWAAAGAEGWSYADVLPYFLKSENNSSYPGSPYHNVGGPMSISTLRQFNPLVLSFLEATRSLQLPQQSDFNGPDMEGFGTRQAAIRNGRRESGTTAFLNPARGRRNLRIVTQAVVQHITLENGRATGVILSQGGIEHKVSARREVILSGGAFGSPAMLLHSGIGPADELKALGITPVIDLPGVGKGLRDHPSAAIQMRTKDTTSYGVSWRKALPNAVDLLRYLLLRRGPLAGNMFEAHGFWKSNPALSRPDLQIIMMPAHRNAAPKPLPQGHGYGIISALVRPKSVGSLSLASSDPAVMPRIDLNFLAEPEDLDRIRAGLKLARRILAAPAFDQYKGHEIIPGPDVQTDDEWDDYIRRTCTMVHHPACSARMGTDPMSVVGPDCGVHGVAGLRIVDASIFPTLVAGNTNAGVVMVAEKASDIILGRPALARLDLPHAA
jgi:choline dehydrogenase-like flavoprotein